MNVYFNALMTRSILPPDLQFPLRQHQLSSPHGKPLYPMRHCKTDTLVLLAISDIHQRVNFEPYNSGIGIGAG